MQTTFLTFPAQGQVNVLTDDLNTDDLAPFEVVMRNETSIISAGTELATLHNTLGNVKFPTRPGYGSIGRVIAKGARVTDFEIGQRAFYAGKHASVQRFLHGQNHQWGRLYPAPENIDPVDAAFVCMAEISMTAVNVAEFDLNDTVAVFGLGLVGNLAAQQFKIAGAKVIGVDVSPKRCAMAKRCGIDTVVDCAADKQVEAIKALTNDRGVHVAVDAAGHAAVIQTAVQCAALFGQIVLLGTPRASLTTDITPMLMSIHERGLVMRGAHMWRLVPDDIREVKQSVAWSFRTNFDLIAAGKLNVRPLRTHLITPAQAPEAYTGLKSQPEDYVGVVIDWRNAG